MTSTYIPTAGLSRRLATILLTALVAALVAPTTAFGADRVVNDDSSGAGPGGADCAAPAYSAIQPAIDAASAGDRILVCEGTYTAQLNVDKPLELVGAGEASIVRSPSQPGVVSRYSLSGFEFQPVIYANADGVKIRSLQVDGDRQGYENGTRLFVGIGALNRDGLTIEDTKITRIQKTPFDGVQTGFGVRVDNTDGASRSFSLSSSRIEEYQKGAVVVRGLGLDGKISDNTLIGVGPQTDIAQNGISMGRGMSGVIEGNTITDHQCDQASCGPDVTQQAQSAGVIMVAASAGGGDVTLDGNALERNDVGVLSSVSDGSKRTVIDNRLTNNRYTGLYAEDGEMQVSGNDISGGNDGVLALSGAGGYVPELSLASNTLRASERGIRTIQIGGAANPPPSVRAHYNRIVGNDAFGLQNDSTGAIDAENNWWGCNEGPNHPGCDPLGGTGAGGIDADPWLVLGITASPTTIETGETAQITADLRHNSDGDDVGPGFPDGVEAAFATTLGTVNPQTDETEDAVARTELSSSTPGEAVVSATLDNETVSTGPITVTKAPPPPPPPPPQPCTITGSPSNDIIRGTSGADVICSLGGADVVYGLGGNDRLYGGAGADELRGGSGADRMLGERGGDRLIGGEGDDHVTGGAGRDVLSGQAGADHLNTRDGVRGNDIANGGPGADSCSTDPRDVRTAC